MAQDISFRYCFFQPTLLKWLEIACCIAIIVLIEPALDIWKAYPFFMFTAAFCLTITFVLVVIYFMGLHRSSLTCWSWTREEISFNFLAAILMFIVFALAVYDTVKMFDNDYNHHDHKSGYPKDFKEKMAGIAAVSGFAGLLYVFSGAYANTGGYIIVRG